jgi:phenylpropionate dioxygenase-like ring-hydroxylating dioxygenase large terminal subunit
MEPTETQSVDAWRAQHTNEIRRRLADHVKHRTTDLVSDGMLIAPEVYTDPVRWEAERREIFRNMPMLACLTQDIPNPGDMYVFEEAGSSILIVRNKEGSVKAFLNMCMHRAAKLVSQCSNRSRLSCPFHAWTYSLEGKLIGVPRREAFDPQDLVNRNLVSVPVGEWGGLVLVVSTPGERRIDVKAHLGSFAMTIASLGLEVASPVAHGRLDYEANWKYALDTYGEGYHIGALHAKTVGSMYYGDLIAVDRHGKHHEMSFAPNAFNDMLQKPEAEWEATSYSPVYFIYPNIAINPQPMPNDRAFISIHRVYAGERIDRGYMLMSTYKRGGPLNESEQAEYLAGHELIMKVVGTEDFSISQGGYQNLRFAPPGFKLVFGRNEHPAIEVQRNIARDIGMPF